MAWLERRNKRFRIQFRYGGKSYQWSLKTENLREAEALCGRLEENLILLERGKIEPPADGNLALFLLSDGKLNDRPKIQESAALAEFFRRYRDGFTAGAKESNTRYTESIHMKHLERIMQPRTPVRTITEGTLQRYVDVRSREETSKGTPVSNTTIQKEIGTFASIWNKWGVQQELVSGPAPTKGLVYSNLSSAVYIGASGYTDPNGVTWNPIQPYWVTDPSNPGFAAEAYENSTDTEVVIAFRGTVFNPFAHPVQTLKDLAADVSFGGLNPSALLQSEVRDAANFVLEIRESNPNVNITLTGHSLGGALAQLIGEASGLPAETFDAPGAGQLYAALSTQLSPVVGLGLTGSTAVNANYRLYGDQVSLFGTAIGTAVTLADPAGTTFSTLFRSVPLLDAMANLGTFLNLHSISNVIGQVAANAPAVSNAGEPNDAQALESWITPNGTVSELGHAAYKFLFTILNTAALALDPSQGSDFVVTEDAGSPSFASFDLPLLPGVASYNFRYATGGVWSAFQTVPPGVQTMFGPNVQGIEFQPLDANRQSVTIVDSFLFAAAFASAGTFSGTLTVATPPDDVATVTSGVGPFTLAADSDGLDIDWWVGTASGQLPVRQSALEAPRSNVRVFDLTRR